MFFKKLKIAIYINHPKEKYNACTMYRNTTPFKYARGVKVRYIYEIKSEIEFDPIRRRVKNIKLDAEPVEWADVVVFSRGYDQVALIGCIAEVAQRMNKPIIYETDDLLHKVEDNIQKHIFETADVRKKFDDWFRIINYLGENSSVVTVTTENLKKFYEEKFGRPAFVMPNYYDPKMWRFLYLYRKLRMFWRRHIKRDDSIRIGWQGGNNHLHHNLKHLVEPINNLKKKYGGKMTFVYMGGDPKTQIDVGKIDMPKFFDEYEYHSPAALMDFPRKLAELDLDIGLIVVEDNEFSRAKSNIKWMEYGLLGIPSISSWCEPYLETNAILVNNTAEAWTDAIESLMWNKQKRAIMGKEAREMTKAFNIKRHAQDWVNLFKRVLNGEFERSGARPLKTIQLSKN